MYFSYEYSVKKGSIQYRSIPFFITFQSMQNLPEKVKSREFSNSVGYAFTHVGKGKSIKWDVFPIKGSIPRDKKKKAKFIIHFTDPENDKIKRIDLMNFCWPGFRDDASMYHIITNQYQQQNSSSIDTLLDSEILLKILMKFQDKIIFSMISMIDNQPHEFYVSMPINLLLDAKYVDLQELKGDNSLNFRLYTDDFANLIKNRVIVIRERKF